MSLADEDPSSSTSSVFSSPLKVLRVNQLDSHQLDAELDMLLSVQLLKAAEFFEPSLVDRYRPEIHAAVQLLMYRLSFFVDGASYGQKLQNLIYRNERWAQSHRPGGTQMVYPLNIWQKLCWGAMTIGGTWGWTRLNRWLVSEGWDDPELPEDSIPRRVWCAVRNLDTAYKCCKVIHFMLFLVNGRYMSLVDRILGIRLVYAHSAVARNVNFEFMNRQIVWHGFTEFLLFLMPLIPIDKLKVLLTRAFRPRAQRDLIPDGSCPVCLSAPTNCPHVAIPCQHVYCYYCIKTSVMQNPKFQCPKCGDRVKGIRQM